ncbi:response regulator [Candidatus Latescibacterota bacterium]
MDNEKIKVMIADDHPIVRKGLKEIVEEIPGVVVTDEAENGYEVLDKISGDNCDLLILDISMPGMGGLETVTKVKTVSTTVKILVFSIYSEDHYAIRFLKAGASGYLSKQSDPYAIVEAINTVINGGKYFSKDILQKYIQSIDSDFSLAPHETLSNREYEIMLLLASGKRISDVAKDLLISAKTVFTHKERIFQKMNIQESAELTQYAVEHELL